MCRPLRDPVRRSRRHLALVTPPAPSPHAPAHAVPTGRGHGPVRPQLVAPRQLLRQTLRVRHVGVGVLRLIQQPPDLASQLLQRPRTVVADAVALVRVRVHRPDGFQHAQRSFASAVPAERLRYRLEVAAPERRMTSPPRTERQCPDTSPARSDASRRSRSRTVHQQRQHHPRVILRGPVRSPGTAPAAPVPPPQSKCGRSKAPRGGFRGSRYATGAGQNSALLLPPQLASYKTRIIQEGSDHGRKTRASAWYKWLAHRHLPTTEALT